MNTEETAAARILLVEDDERLAQLVAEALRKSGYAVTHCINGLDGEAMMRAEAFDVVLLDGHLPGKDGFDVLRDVASASTVSGVVFWCRNAVIG
ncbi:MAG: response regulator [Burkholderiaceae bacterium]|nr:response regulator [Burkholderiaceae bacterium]